MKAIGLIVTGVVVLLGSIAHGGIGWPAVKHDLMKANIPADLLVPVGAVWIFGTLSMVTFGAIIVIAGLQLRKGNPASLTAVTCIGIAYILFGAGAVALVGFDLHLLLFAVLGLAMVVCSVGKTPARA